MFLSCFQLVGGVQIGGDDLGRQRVGWGGRRSGWSSTRGVAERVGRGGQRGNNWLWGVQSVGKS